MIYLDHNATSPLLPAVLHAMRPWLGVPANPASVHRAGQRARIAVEQAREHVAALVGGNPAGVVFTSGATEANNTFLWGLSDLAVSPIEHPSVLQAAPAARRLAVGADGVVVVDEAPAMSVMAANHETGVIQPRPVGAVTHVDATQAAGRIPLDLGDIDGVVLSSHKLGGPGGVGALILKDGEPFPPLLVGGGQERGRRAGTVNVAGVVGFGEACRLALVELNERAARYREQRDRIDAAVLELGGRIVGSGARLPNTTCAVFAGLPGESLVQALDLHEICVSSGAACASGSVEPSPVLLSMGDPEPLGAVRFSVGWNTLPADIDRLLDVLPSVLDQARLFS